MPIPSGKKDLKEAIGSSYSKLKEDLSDISAKLSRERTMEGHAKGTRMSVCDQMAYLIGWGELVLKWDRKKEKGEPVDFPETGFKWNELGKLAQKFYKDYENESLERLKSKLDTTVRRILDMVENKSNEDLYKKTWYEKYTQGRMIQLNTSSPYKNASGRIRKWKKSSKLRVQT